MQQHARKSVETTDTGACRRDLMQIRFWKNWRRSACQRICFFQLQKN